MDVNQYEALVDVSATWEEGDIDVITLTVEAPNASTAYAKLCQDIADGKHEESLQGRKTYVWDIMEDDKIT